MMGLPEGPKSFQICLVVLIQYRLRQTPSHPASHVAVAITLNAKASSLKIAKTPNWPKITLAASFSHGLILKIIFRLYIVAILADQREIWKRDEGSHADIGHVTKTVIFANSRWRTAAILKYPFLHISAGIIRVRLNLVLYRETAHSLSTFV